MADDEITVNAPDAIAPKRRPPGMSPLATALLYGGAASTVMGPPGLIIGGAYGLLQKGLRDSWLDREAKFAERTESERQAFLEQMHAELQEADPDEARAIRHAMRLYGDGYQRLMAGDETGRALMDQANNVSLGIISADSQARKQDEASAMSIQRGLVQTAANAYRQEFQTNLQQFEQVDNQASRLLGLVSDPEFDPNKPANKAILAELISTGIGGFYRDAPDMWDGVSQGSDALSGIPVVGQYAPDIIKGVVTAVKAKDFKVSREDYNRLALNMKQFAEQHTRRRMDQLSQQAAQLDEFALQTRSIPQGYSLREYISGGIDDLQLSPVPEVAKTPTIANAPTARNTPTRALQELKKWSNPRALMRPTN